MIRIPLLAFLFLSGCNAARIPPEPVSVNTANLVRTYRDTPSFADDCWKDRPIRCTIHAGNYTHRDRVICFESGLPNAAPCIVFEFSTSPSPTGDIEIVGTCRGIIRDGQHRGRGVDFCIRVDGCSITR